MKIESFEDLQVWQKARKLVNKLYGILAAFPREEKFNLTDQLRRAAISIMLNIAEGFSRYHAAETMMFYRNARGSLAEVKCCLYIAADRQYITDATLREVLLVIDEIGKMLNGLINATKAFRETKN